MRAPLTRTLTTAAVFTDRAVDIVAVPFDQVIRIGTDEREAFAPDVRVELLRDPIPALLHHDERQPFGHVTIAGRTAAGIHATMHAAHTKAGDEALELAAAGVLFPSIGFSSIDDDIRDGVIWRRAVTLWEVSLVTFPAYAGGATVTQVRDADQPDPRQKPWLAWLDGLQRDNAQKGRTA